MVLNLGSADPLGVYITVNGGGPRSPKIGHRGSAGEKRLRTTVLLYVIIMYNNQFIMKANLFTVQYKNVKYSMQYLTNILINLIFQLFYVNTYVTLFTCHTTLVDSTRQREKLRLTN